jgi:Restriction endonuclease BglII
MENRNFIPKDIAARYDIREWRNGFAILAAARPKEWADILAVLAGFKLLRSDVVNPGGSKSDIAKKIDGHFTSLGWREKQFQTKITVDDQTYHAPTHKVDCYKNRVALRTRIPTF